MIAQKILEDKQVKFCSCHVCVNNTVKFLLFLYQHYDNNIESRINCVYLYDLMTLNPCICDCRYKDWGEWGADQGQPRLGGWGLGGP